MTYRESLEMRADEYSEDIGKIESDVRWWIGAAQTEGEAEAYRALAEALAEARLKALELRTAQGAESYRALADTLTAVRGKAQKIRTA